jgi:uncharacterized protein DUF6349
MPTTPRAAVEQLDLFAETEAADEQRAYDEAPSIYGTAVRGYFERLDAADAWVAAHGNFDSNLRSHAWRPARVSPDGRYAAEDAHRPAVLTADLRCHDYDEECSCVGDLVYRGACLHRNWEGDVRADENTAAEDAHDHAWPGWRDLPIVPRRPENQKAQPRSIEAVTDAYPAGRLESGGPIRTARGHYGTRHVPNHTGFGGYDLCGAIARERAS